MPVGLVRSSVRSVASTCGGEAKPHVVSDTLTVSAFCSSRVLSHFRTVVSVIVIAFLSSEHYFSIGCYSYFYSYGLLLKLNDWLIDRSAQPCSDCTNWTELDSGPCLIPVFIAVYFGSALVSAVPFTWFPCWKFKSHNPKQRVGFIFPSVRDAPTLEAGSLRLLWSVGLLLWFPRRPLASSAVHLDRPLRAGDCRAVPDSWLPVGGNSKAAAGLVWSAFKRPPPRPTDVSRLQQQQQQQQL